MSGCKKTPFHHSDPCHDGDMYYPPVWLISASLLTLSWSITSFQQRHSIHSPADYFRLECQILFVLLAPLVLRFLERKLCDLEEKERRLGFLLSLPFWGYLSALAYAQIPLTTQKMLIGLVLAALGIALPNLCRRFSLVWRDPISTARIGLPFFLSGFSALMLQVIWQRELYVKIGVNAESIAVIIAVFMLGLGGGSLIGSCFHRRLIPLFIAIECAIGLYAVISLHWFDWITRILTQETLGERILTVFGVYGIPTLLMGASLPLLVEHFDQRGIRPARGMGYLYGINTWGGACGALFTSLIGFVWMDLNQLVFVAGFVNLVAGLLCLSFYRQTGTVVASPEIVSAPHSSLGWKSALLGAALVGFVSMSQEIIWCRVLSFATASLPEIFGLMIGLLLAGIAQGCLNSLAEDAPSPLRNLFTATCVYASAFLVAGLFYRQLSQAVGILVILLSIFAVGYLTGPILPFLLDVFRRRSGTQHAGRDVSTLYLINVLGCTVGSLVTGFLLLDLLPLHANVALQVFLLLITLALFRVFSLKRVLCMMLIGVPLTWFSFSSLLSQFLPFGGDRQVLKMIEGRSGVIALLDDSPQSPVVIGGGAYDGRLSSSIRNNLSGIQRAYLPGLLHSSPQKVLEIGMSGGAWTAILTSFPLTKKLTVVEINPKYHELAESASYAEALHDPKINYVADDGRAWLRHHPEEQFDVIIMNTTIYWRNHSSFLLSKEFLQLLRSRLRPGGMVLYNSTGLADAYYTAQTIFPHVYEYANMVIAMGSPLEINAPLLHQRMALFDGGRDPLYTDVTLRDFYTRSMLRHLSQPWQAPEHPLWVITDHNMAPEFKIHR